MQSEGKKEEKNIQYAAPLFPNKTENAEQNPYINGFSINPFYDFQKNWGTTPL
jgi:hypothetical protein